MTDILIIGEWQSDVYPSGFCYGNLEIYSPVTIVDMIDNTPYNVVINVKYKGFYRWNNVDTIKSQIIKKGDNLSVEAVYNNSIIKYVLDCITMTGKYYLTHPHDIGSVKLKTEIDNQCILL